MSYWRTCIIGENILQENMSYWMACLAGRHVLWEDILHVEGRLFWGFSLFVLFFCFFISPSCPLFLMSTLGMGGGGGGGCIEYHISSYSPEAAAQFFAKVTVVWSEFN